MADPLRMRANWAGNVAFRATAFHRPGSISELQHLVAGSSRIRALGSAHSFSRVADTDGELVSLAGLPPEIEIDTAGRAVRASAGLRYSDIAPRLNDGGLALANLASLPHIGLAGAVATGTHGSGDHNASLAAAVTELELVTAAGDLITVRREGGRDEFAGLVVALGACGIVTRLTLTALPAFSVRQWVCEDIPFDAVIAQFDHVTGAAYSVSVFTDWGHRRRAQVWLKRREPAHRPPSGWLGGRLAGAARHPIAGQPARNATPQLGVPGPWHERLPHFRPEFTPSAGRELQSEFLLGREHAAGALTALDQLRATIAPFVQISEIRTIAADDLWLSPAYGRDTVAIHFTWVPDAAAVSPVLRDVEAALAPFAPRPHWGKITSIPPAVVADRYPRMDDFRRLVREFDPTATFRNEYTGAFL
jgi:alditol oxidase